MTPQGLPGEEAEAAAAAIARQAVARGEAGLRAAGSALAEACTQPPAPAPEWVDVTDSGQRLAVRAWGPAARDARGTVLFLHGMGLSGAAAAGLGRNLARQGWRTVAPDLRGHGASSRSREGRYAPGELARDLAGLILELGLYSCPLCVAGEGLGAAVALELVALRPRLVGALFLVGLRGLFPAAGASRGIWCRLQRGGLFPSLAHIALALMQAAAGPDRCATALGAARAARAMVLPGAALPGQVTGGVDIAPAVDPEFFSPLDFASLCSAASGVEAPVALLDSDGEEGEGAARDVTRHLRRAERIAHAGGAGRQALAERPLEVYRALKGFLEASEALLAPDAAGEPRRPEALGLRELPEFASLDAARRALLGRAPPSATDIAEALGSDGEDGAAGHAGGAMTALAINPPDYFGMVG